MPAGNAERGEQTKPLASLASNDYVLLFSVTKIVVVRYFALAASWCDRVVPGVRFQEVRLLVSMTQVLEILGFVGCERSGNEIRGACPVHRSTSPKSRSFSANLARNVYRCFRCGSAGNHLDLYAAATHQSLYAAAIDLCARVGCAVPWIKPSRSREGTPGC